MHSGCCGSKMFGKEQPYPAHAHHHELLPAHADLLEDLVDLAQAVSRAHLLAALLLRRRPGLCRVRVSRC